MSQPQFRATKPDDIQFTLKLTYSLRSWRKLRKELNVSHPSWEIGREIDSMVKQAEKTFCPPKSASDVPTNTTGEQA